MAEDFEKPKPSDVPEGDKEMMQSDAERAAAAPESDEFQLTPEIEEQIMDKVQNINKKGTAFTIIGGAKELMRGWNPFGGGYVSSKPNRIGHTANLIESGGLEKILKEGLLGTPEGSSEELDLGLPSSRHTKKEWAKNAKDDRNAVVYFNIVGDSVRRIYDMWWSQLSNVILLFNLRKREISPPASERRKLNEIRKTEPRLNMQPEFGYNLSFRVRPSDFLGLIISSTTEHIDRAELRPELYENIQQTIIDKQIKTNGGTPDRLVPIYNEKGGLVWPRQLSYKEVKAFVAERDAKKKEEMGDEKIEETLKEAK